MVSHVPSIWSLNVGIPKAHVPGLSSSATGGVTSCQPGTTWRLMMYGSCSEAHPGFLTENLQTIHPLVGIF